MGFLLTTCVLSLSQGFYVGLRLVACAQSGHDVSLSSLNLTVPPPKFVSMLASIKAIKCCYIDFTHLKCKDNAAVSGRK